MSYTAKSRLVATVLVAFVSSLMLSGCSDKSTRAANRSLRSQISLAQELMDSAMVISESPATRVEGNIASDDAKVEVEPGADPQAIAKLAEARKAIETGLAQADQADESVKAMAKAQLALVGRLQGWLLSINAKNELAQAQALLAKQRDLAVDARGSSGKIKYAQTLLDEIASGQQTPATQSLANLRKQITNVSKQIEEKSAQRSQMLTAVEQLTRDASELRLLARATPGEKSLELADQCMEKQLQAGELTLKVGEIDQELEKLDASKDQLGWQIGVQESLAEIAGVSRKKAGEEAKEVSKHLTTARDEAGKSLKEIQTASEELAKRIESGATIQGQVKDLLTKALRDATEALGNASSDEVSQRASIRGDVAMALGDLCADRVAFSGIFSDCVSDIAEAYSDLSQSAEMPRALSAGPATYMPSVDDEREAAVEAYRSAVDAYKRSASTMTDRTNMWVYQAQIGSAHLALYRLTKDTSDLQDARDAMTKAMTGPEGSPSLSDVAALHKETGATN